MQATLSKRRGFMNGLTAQIHEEIVMDDRLCDDAVVEARKAEASVAGDSICRLYSMRTSKRPEGVDWPGIAKSLAKSV